MRGGRDDDGWKLTKVELRATLEEEGLSIRPTSVSPPVRVKPVKRLERDLQGLERLTQSELPPFWPIRSKHIYVAKYGFGDASGSGFGSSVDSGSGVRV